MEGALRGGAGAVDGDLKPIEFFVRQVFRRIRFEIGAAAETPGGVDDFAGEGLFESRVRREFGEVVGFELIKEVLFFGVDKVGDREQTKFGGVSGNGGVLAFGGDRTGGDFSAFCRLARIWAGVDIASKRLPRRLLRRLSASCWNH